MFARLLVIVAVFCLGLFSSTTQVIFAQEQIVPPLGTFTEFDTPPQPIEGLCPQPNFPAAAKEAGLEGEVIMQVFVSNCGQVILSKVIHEEPMDCGFGAAADSAVTKWQFEPAKQFDKPVGIWITIPFNFRLQDPDAKKKI